MKKRDVKKRRKEKGKNDAHNQLQVGGDQKERAGTSLNITNDTLESFAYVN